VEKNEKKYTEILDELENLLAEKKDSFCGFSGFLTGLPKIPTENTFIKACAPVVETVINLILGERKETDLENTIISRYFGSIKPKVNLVSLIWKYWIWTIEDKTGESISESSLSYDILNRIFDYVEHYELV